MKNISLHLHGKIEPSIVRLLSGAARVAAAQNVPFFVVGASARDLVLEHGYGMRSTRATTDIDLGIAIADWQAYQRFFSAMAEDGILKPVAGVAHKYELVDSSLTVDIVPFGDIEEPVGTIAWPPEFETRMTVTGFSDAYACAWSADIAQGVNVKVASLHGLAFLKLLAWRARRHETVRDGVDLAFILRHYGSPVMQERLMNESFAVWESEDFDTLAAGARLLGQDMASAMGLQTRLLVLDTIESEMQDQSGLKLAGLIAGVGAEDAAIERALKQLARIRDGIGEVGESSNVVAEK